jgi:hypothetical protein
LKGFLIRKSFVFRIDFSSHAKPPNWQQSAWQLDPDNTSNNNNNGFQNQDFIVWMRTAAMPTFRKLYRKLDANGTGIFQNGLPKGSYALTVTYSKMIFFFHSKNFFFAYRLSGIKF